jgi:hypothetical protein
VRARPGGFALWSKRGPAGKTADSAERRCRCPTVVAQPGAAKPQQLHHVPVMLRCSGAGPPARSHKSAVRSRLSSWGDFPIFSSHCRGGRRHRDGWHTNTVPRAAEPEPSLVTTTVNDRLPRTANRRRSASGSTSTPRTRISSDPQSSAANA